MSARRALSSNSGEIAKSPRKRAKTHPTTTASKRKKITRKPNRIKSINDQMTKKYSKSPLLMALSGKKKKVSDLLKKIQDVESSELQDQKRTKSDLSTFETIDSVSQSEDDSTSPELNKISRIYTKNEWSQVIKCINENLPKLSKRTKKTLNQITARYNKSPEDDDKILSLWESASQAPRLEESQVKELYDFLDDEKAKSFLTSDVSDDGEFVGSQKDEMVLTLKQWW
ncbi:unnamed protein product [Ambrosiozyma monospora]|uniref:Unnamed protein product n=1 Tax=Ambrosiozyma monospora TaxID=43982 RepID=A0ACB5UAA3_AMBMO|nr:unnamed protein product [Ambrosiozyma monospora]